MKVSLPPAVTALSAESLKYNFASRVRLLHVVCTKERGFCSMDSTKTESSFPPAMAVCGGMEA